MLEKKNASVRLMIEDLLKAKKISQCEYDLYYLYQINELGYKLLHKMIEQTFMEEPNEPSDPGFAFISGRQSVWRDVKKSILHVQQLLKENNHV